MNSSRTAPALPHCQLADKYDCYYQRADNVAEAMTLNVIAAPLLANTTCVTTNIRRLI